MSLIVISGGLYPENWKTIQKKKDENFIRFNTAELLILDWDTKKVVKKINHISEPDALNPSLMFKGCEVDETHIRVVTNTEIVEYDIKTFDKTNVISDKTFNDLHAVKKIGDEIYVVNTGLEMLQVVDVNGTVIREYNMTDTDTWSRFDKDFDYRHTGSTKPHESHINNVFEIDNEIFVTRLLQKDAADLSKKSVFDVEVGNPHDGLLYENKVYFTTTNGHVVVFDAKTKERLGVYDINQILEESHYKAGGWCRGVLPIANNKVLVGYTQLRHTKFKEFVSMTIKMGDKPAPTRILEVDLDNNSITDEYVYPDVGNNGAAIFSIHQI